MQVPHCVGGVISPLLANIYLSVLDRHFQTVWERDMSPPWRRQHRRRKGLPNYRLVRFADDFVVLVHGTQSDAETIRAQIGEVLGRELKMTLSVDKTHITHIDDGFAFLGFRIQRRRRGDGRRVVLTIPSKQALAAVMHKSPPCGMASLALTARLSIATSNCETSTSIGHRSPAMLKRTEMFSLSEWSSKFARSSIWRSTFNTSD